MPSCPVRVAGLRPRLLGTGERRLHDAKLGVPPTQDPGRRQSGRERRGRVRRLRDRQHALGRQVNDARADQPTKAGNQIAQLPARPAALGANRRRRRVLRRQTPIPRHPVGSLGRPRPRAGDAWGAKVGAGSAVCAAPPRSRPKGE